LATSVPADAHGDADVGGLQRRRVVHAVAGDGDDLALLLQRLDDQHLLLGGDAGEEDLRRIERQLQLRRRHQARSCSPLITPAARL
jgi:hypothetical protein